MKTVGILLIIVMILLFPGCSSDRIAGSKGGSETTNGIMATIVDGNGSPAVGSIVRIRRADYISNPDSTYEKSADRFDIVTDDDGTFSVEGVQPGFYHIEINNNGEAVLLICTIGETDTIDLGSQSLRPHAFMHGKVDRYNGTEELIVQVRGLERIAKVEQNGFFNFDDLPAGKMDIRVVNRSSDETREIRDVVTTSGDSVTVQVPEKAAWSRYFYFDTLVTDMAKSVRFSGFPLLVRLDNATFDFSQARSAGEDIRFTKTDGTALPYEIEQWDPAAEEASVWVRIDTVYGGRSDQAFIMQWGNQEAESLSDKKAVFNSEDGFWHCNDIETSLETVAGVVGSALRFDGNDDIIQLDSLNLTGDYTLSCWVKFADLNTSQRIIWKDTSYTLWYDQNIGGLRVEHCNDLRVWHGINQDSDNEATAVTADKWYHIVGTFGIGNVGELRLYVNGEVVDSTGKIVGDPHISKEPLFLGGAATEEFFNGILDEVRIENVRHSAEWIRLCYRNQYRENLQ